MFCPVLVLASLLETMKLKFSNRQRTPEKQKDLLYTSLYWGSQGPLTTKTSGNSVYLQCYMYELVLVLQASPGKAMITANFVIYYNYVVGLHFSHFILETMLLLRRIVLSMLPKLDLMST